MAAPKGNKNALGNNGGRPPIWDDPEKLQVAIDDYFESGKKITITGLALYLGFESRISLYDYREKIEFSIIIKKAITRVEESYEEKLHEGNCTGSIFALKNMGWKDKNETDVNLKTPINLVFKPPIKSLPLDDEPGS